MKIYRECIKEPYSFLTIDTTLPASNSLRFRKKLLPIYKNAVTDRIKILERKIKQNEAQYNLDKKAAIIFASFSNNLVDKYEYLRFRS